jgi:hypothetical protein
MITTTRQQDAKALLQHVYNAFNAHDIDTAFEAIHADVVWANGMEGGLVNGHDGVRDYWSRQWSYIDWHVKPVNFEEVEEGVVLVDVNQIIRDFSGNIVSIKDVQHIFQIEDGLVTTMRILQ